MPVYNYKHIVVVHGIGNQAPNETALGFMNEFIRALPLEGARKLSVHNLIESVDALAAEKPEESRKFQPAFVTYSDAKSVNVIGFSEVYWQPITNGFIKKNEDQLPIPISTWAHSIATRLLGAGTGQSTFALAGWRAAIENLETLLRVLGKIAGLLGRERDFDAVTTKFLGDVQMYAESDVIRQKINGKFVSVLARVDTFANHTRKIIQDRLEDPLFLQFNEFTKDRDFAAREIYVVSHSEGTVVAYNSLVQAQMVRDKWGRYADGEIGRALKDYAALPDGSDHDWLDKVQGLVTLGCPLDKHYLIWRSRFRKHQLKNSPERRIPWLNFYDTNDPVAYSLRELRTPDPCQAGTDTDADRMFDLDGQGADCGFERYPVPGVAHVKYWTDRKIHDQIVHLMGLSVSKPDLPGSIPWVRAIRLPSIWLGYPIVRGLTFGVGLFCLNRLLHAFGASLGGLTPLFSWLALQPLTLGSQANYAFWLAAPVLLMKGLTYAEQGFDLTCWIRWILSVVWFALAVVICIGLDWGKPGTGASDIMGYASGIVIACLVWKLHTAVHRGLIQLWYYTAQA